MRGKIILIIMVVSLLFVLYSFAQSEISWGVQENNPQPVRQLVGLPTIAVGNLNVAARNPGVEIWCTAFFDVPGGYCHYFTQGVPHTNLAWCEIGEQKK